MKTNIEIIDSNMKISSISSDIKWIDPKDYPSFVYGFRYFNEDKTYRRLSKSFSQKLSNYPALQFLEGNTAGGQLRFKTTSKKIYIRAKLGAKHSMSRMAALGESGFDLYARHEGENRYTFFGSTPFDVSASSYESLITNQLKEGIKEIIINFPLYNTIESLEVGLEKDSKIFYKDETDKAPIVIYGTSITQGGCVSRPGLAYPNIISREFENEVYNFGFSGNAFGQYEVAEIIRDFDKIECLVLDYEANGGTNGTLEKSMKHFIEIVREKHKDTKILIVSRIQYIEDFYLKWWKDSRDRLRNFQKNIVEEFKLKGDNNIFFLDGYSLFDEDWREYTTDMIHPNDIGHYQIGKKLTSKIKEIINE